MNCSLSSVSKGAFAALAAALFFAGCGPSDGLKELAKAEEFFKLKDLKKAEKKVGEALECNEENLDALVLLTRIKLRLGELPDADKAIKKALALMPNEPDLRLLDAQTAYYLHDNERAIKDYQLVREAKTSDGALRSRALVGLGVMMMVENDFPGARCAFLEAIREDRRNASAYYHLGHCYREAYFDYKEAALEQYEIYVRLETEDAERVRKTQRTIIAELKDALQRQAAEMPGAAKRDSAASAAALLKAENLLKAKRKNFEKLAREEYQKAYNADILSYPAAIGLARQWEKTEPSLEGRKKTLKLYKQACKLNPGAIKELLHTGDLATALNQPVIAAEAYSRAMAASPRSTTAIDGLIRALRKCGGKENEKAARTYQAYRDRLPRRK